ncbi:hypothetical protein [Prevotella sp. S7 MS 2]|uniref:hypothetical protein n=1 Tax=Prevotella sp. S7 MS 2 TaxID=1287488 RepID=UPI00056A6BFC|nr:hypothetical protein [Prevotella sp. S7 MS 2]
MIDQDEDILKRKYGKATGFRAPDGYFDQLASDVMSKIQEPQQAAVVSLKRRVHRRVNSIIAAAACVGVVGIALWTYLSKSEQTPTVPSEHWIANVNAGEISADEVVDYTMMDNEAIYASLVNE